MKLEELKKKYPDVVKAIVADARGESTIFDDDRAQWDADPALRAEFLNNYLMFSAYKKAEAAGRVTFYGGAGAKWRTDPQPPAEGEKIVPIEQRARTAWDADARLHSEFSDFDAYLAYERAMEDGRVRMVGGGAK